MQRLLLISCPRLPPTTTMCCKSNHHDSLGFFLAAKARAYISLCLLQTLIFYETSVDLNCTPITSCDRLFLFRTLTKPNFSHRDVSGSQKLIDAKYLDTPSFFDWIEKVDICSTKIFGLRVNGINWGQPMQGFHSQFDFSISKFKCWRRGLPTTHLVKACFQFGGGGRR